MELREKLDMGEDPILDDINPMVIASVIKVNIGIFAVFYFSDSSASEW